MRKAVLAALYPEIRKLAGGGLSELPATVSCAPKLSYLSLLADPMGFLVQFAGWVPSSRNCLNRLVTPTRGWRPNSMMSTQRPSAWTPHTSLLGEAAGADRFTTTW